MTNRFRRQWEALGTVDPYWAVLTESGKQDGGWNRAEFFQTGLDEIADLLGRISGLGIELGRELALDYGCGVGRLSRALSTSFRRVLAVDISEAMLAEARRANAGFGNIQFQRNTGDSLAGVGDETVDFLYSNIVLQHAPAKVQRSLIREFCRVLRPGGLLVFQTPSHPNPRTVSGVVQFVLGNRILNVARRMRYRKDRVMEVHWLNRDQVLQLLRQEGMSVREVERFDFAGASFISYRYFAVKG